VQNFPTIGKMHIFGFPKLCILLLYSLLLRLRRIDPEFFFKAAAEVIAVAEAHSPSRITDGFPPSQQFCGKMQLGAQQMGMNALSRTSAEAALQTRLADMNGICNVGNLQRLFQMGKNIFHGIRKNAVLMLPHTVHLALCIIASFLGRFLVRTPAICYDHIVSVAKFLPNSKRVQHQKMQQN